MSVWRIALTPWLGLILAAAAQIVNTSVGAQPWRGDALLIALWVWTATFLCGPLVGIVAAIDGDRLFGRRPTVWGLADVRGPVVRRVWLAGTLATLLPTVAALAWMAATVHYVNPEVLMSVVVVVLAGVLTVAAVIGLGLALGSRFGRVYGPLTAFGLILVLQLASYLGAAPVFMVGGVSDSLLGLRLTTVSMLVQLLTLTLISVACALVLRAPPVAAQRRTGPDKTVLALGALVAVALLWPQLGAPQFQTVAHPDSGRSCVELRPDGRLPGVGTVCVAGEHGALDEDVQRLWSTIHQAAQTAGITELPEHLQEVAPSVGPSWHDGRDPGTVAAFSMTAAQLDPEQGGLTVEWLAQEAATPLWCPGLWADVPPADEYFEAVDRAQTALLTVLDDPSSRDAHAAAQDFDAAWAALKSCLGAS